MGHNSIRFIPLEVLKLYSPMLPAMLPPTTYQTATHAIVHTNDDIGSVLKLFHSTSRRSRTLGAVPTIQLPTSAVLDHASSSLAILQQGSRLVGRKASLCRSLTGLRPSEATLAVLIECAVSVGRNGMPRVRERPPGARDAHLATHDPRLDSSSNAAATVTRKSECDARGVCAP